MNVRLARTAGALRAGSARAALRRRGGILLLFALLTFAFLAIAGLVIDVGLANLTQAQMQSAVDSAALEGCRARNFDEQLGDSNREKRIRAGAMVRLAFDDDLNPTRGGYMPEGQTTPTSPDDADESNVTAGTTLRVSGGEGDWNANAVLGAQPDSELARLDDPRLQENRQQNLRWGDMVAGSFVQDRLPAESSTYEREDFNPAAPGTASLNSLSFLVRMRRAGTANPSDAVTGVSSSLPTVPIVFGLGSTIRQAEGEDWDPRRDGITVRATAIASARPAMRVGRTPCDELGAPVYDHEPGVPAQYREPIAGLVPFYITRDAWMRHFRDEAWQARTDQSFGKVEVRSDGGIHLVTGTAEFPTTAEVGAFLFDAASAPANPCDVEAGWPDIVGKSVTRATSSPVRGFRYTRRKPAYIAIVQPILDPNGTPRQRVIGYGFAHVWPDDSSYDPSAPPSSFSGTGRFVISAGEVLTHGVVRAWVAQDNASGILNSALDPIVAPVLDDTVWDKVLAWANVLAFFPGSDAPPDPLTFMPELPRLHDYTYVQQGTVLAPALTR